MKRQVGLSFDPQIKLCFVPSAENLPDQRFYRQKRFPNIWAEVIAVDTFGEEFMVEVHDGEEVKTFPTTRINFERFYEPVSSTDMKHNS